MKIFSKKHGGVNRCNEGQVIIELIYVAAILVGIVILFKDPQYNFVEKFKTKVKGLHDKRNEAVRRIREREQSGSYYRDIIKLSNSITPFFPNKTM